MKFKLTPLNVGIILALLILTVTMAYLSLQKEKPAEFYVNKYSCNGELVPFRANVSECDTVKISPATRVLEDLLLSPNSDAIYILLDQDATLETVLSANEIHKTFLGMDIPVFLAYTQETPEHPEIPQITVDEANYSNPVIWLRPNSTKTAIEADGPKVFIYAESQYDLDLATCKVALTLIKRVFDC